MAAKKEISEYLSDFGLSETETQLYLALLEISPSTVLELSKHSGIKRTTAHVNIESLIEKGLVAQTKKGARRKLIAERPEKIKELIFKRKNDLKNLEVTLPNIIKELNESIVEKKTQSSIRYYEGETGFKQVSDRSIEKASDEILFISNLDEWYKIYSEEYDKKHYIPIRLKKNIKLKMLVLETPLTRSLRSKDKEYLRTTKFLPKETAFDTTTLIYDKEVSIMISSSPYISILIESEEINKTFKAIFDLLEKISN